MLTVTDIEGVEDADDDPVRVRVCDTLGEDDSEGLADPLEVDICVPVCVTLLVEVWLDVGIPLEEEVRDAD